ncbi:MAG: hypothetical protein WA003_07360 [Desulfuromonadaceae bacterium]
MKKLMIGLIAAMAFVWAAQVQAAGVTRREYIKPVFDKQCICSHGTDSWEQGEFGS